MSDPATMRTWLAHPLEDAVDKALARLREAEDVHHVAVMPDVHLASDVCVGVALATRERVYPQAVGRDIGCGMLALAFDVPADALDDERMAAHLLAGFESRIPAIAHRREHRRPLPEGLQLSGASMRSLGRRLVRDGERQLGTLGRGNHFLELQEDEEGRLWVMIHSGSRGVGSAVFDHHVARATRWSSGLAGLDGEEAEAYRADHDLAFAFAEANRSALLEAACEVVHGVLGGRPTGERPIRCQHNHVVPVEAFGQSWLVHRKGSMSAMEGEEGVLPGSMGTASYHVVGR